jgi:hypothetical protein
MGKYHRKKPSLQPFFDRIDNPEIHHFPAEEAIDITPPPPVLSEFDRAVLHVCGDLGHRVSRQDFQELLRANPTIFTQIKAAVDGEIFPNRNSDIEFMIDLTSIWCDRQGFEHIFCGTIHGYKIKGMHYAGRYLQLQDRGIAGRLPHNFHREEVIPKAIYTVGVLLKLGDRILVNSRKGYALVTDAVELLIAATKAFKSHSTGSTTCTYPVVDNDTEITYSAVLVKENNAIVTFYPDATPTQRMNGCVSPPSPPILGGTRESQSPPELGETRGQIDAKLVL